MSDICPKMHQSLATLTATPVRAACSKQSGCEAPISTEWSTPKAYKSRQPERRDAGRASPIQIRNPCRKLQGSSRSRVGMDRRHDSGRRNVPSERADVRTHHRQHEALTRLQPQLVAYGCEPTASTTSSGTQFLLLLQQDRLPSYANPLTDG